MIRLSAVVLSLLVWPALASVVKPSLINGMPVNDPYYKEVVAIEAEDGDQCSATIVGPRVIVTAAHCVTEGGQVSFKFEGKAYNAETVRSPLYQTRDHDVAVGVTTKAIANALPFRIGKDPKVGSPLTLLGYGCIKTNSIGADGILRMGNAVLNQISAFRLTSATPSGAMLCPGDSGGPALAKIGREDRIVGVNSAVGVEPSGLIKGPNHHARLDSPEAIDFLNKVATDYGVDICGINSDC